MMSYKELTLKKKLQHLWYYYKWSALGTLVAAVALIILFKNIFFGEKFDCTVLYISTGYLKEEQMDELKTRLSAAVPDSNGDGEKKVRVLNIEFAPDPSRANRSLEQNIGTKMIAEISMQDNCFILIKNEKADLIMDKVPFAEFDTGKESLLRLPADSLESFENSELPLEDMVFIFKPPYSKGHEKAFQTSQELAEKFTGTKIIIKDHADK